MLNIIHVFYIIIYVVYVKMNVIQINLNKMYVIILIVNQLNVIVTIERYFIIITDCWLSKSTILTCISLNERFYKYKIRKLFARNNKSHTAFNFTNNASKEISYLAAKVQ